MPKMISYNRSEAVAYAKKWANERNPLYYNYDDLGGDCTNFVSQCLYAGSRIMNYTPTYGWYYINTNYHSPSWTGVQYLYNFLTTNKTEAVFGSEVDIEKLEIGDIVQLGNKSGEFYHSLLVIRIEKNPTLGTVYIATHTFDSYDRVLASYSYDRFRCLHIEGVYQKTNS